VYIGIHLVIEGLIQINALFMETHKMSLEVNVKHIWLFVDIWLLLDIPSGSAEEILDDRITEKAQSRTNGRRTPVLVARTQQKVGNANYASKNGILGICLIHDHAAAHSALWHPCSGRLFRPLGTIFPGMAILPREDVPNTSAMGLSHIGTRIGSLVERAGFDGP
jgi:hypothetical protein